MTASLVEIAFMALEETFSRTAVRQRRELQAFVICLVDRGELWSFDPRRARLFERGDLLEPPLRLLLDEAGLCRLALGGDAPFSSVRFIGDLRVLRDFAAVLDDPHSPLSIRMRGSV
jgi:hypothetical protein